MRVIPFIISAVVTTGLVYALNKKWGDIPPLGKLLSPQQGFWQNAEPSNQDFDGELSFSDLKGKVDVYFDERLVPHVFAENDEDLYFVQGYLHAKFRLFQMDLSTKAAEGRAAEIVGAKAIRHDRLKRRLGMRYAAETALREAEKDPNTKLAFDSYTKGVNTYISSLTSSSLPVEYKLLDLQPEKWSNIRTALLLKMMAEMLSSGTERDLISTNSQSNFSQDELKQIYPQVPDSLLPIVPKGTVFPQAGIMPVAPASADSLYLRNKKPIADLPFEKQNDNNGSNNWVVAGSKTQSGAPILCNDPHLELSLPSIWFEIQLTTPGSNVYGASLPGTPFVIIGFNDHIAWGVTNAQRDVKDYYEIKFQDNKTKREYWFNGQWKKTDLLREEKIIVRGGKPFYDTVAYTAFGPVMYDEGFLDDYEIAKGRNLAVRWVAHDPSNDGLAFYKLNRAKSYAEYEEAIKSFDCPGQNFVFASKTGDIAIWQQGKFPARWDRQGLYIMPGEDSSYMWQGFIPQGENPHALNPERGYLQSANQRPADSTYPYFIPGTYISARGITIDHKLAAMNGITPADMKKLQVDYFNTTAEDARPLLVKYVKEGELNADEKKYLDMLKGWDLNASPTSTGQTVFKCWWDSLETGIWKDELMRTTPGGEMPNEQTTLEWLLRDSAMRYIDDVNTPTVETLYDVVTTALKKATIQLKKADSGNGLEWAKFKDPGIYHISDKGKSALLPFARLHIPVGGDDNIINALTQSHGPSWRMIVQLSSPTEAYGVYPAGQSGNPGSKYYDNFVDTWVKGEYYPLWFMREGDKMDKKVKWVLKFSK
jgi:penicillin amidase